MDHSHATITVTNVIELHHCGKPLIPLGPPLEIMSSSKWNGSLISSMWDCKTFAHIQKERIPKLLPDILAGISSPIT